MFKWSFNHLFLQKLAEVLGVSVTRIAKRSDISQPVLYNNVSGKVEFTVQSLIKVCNAWRIPSRYFISEDNHHIIPNRETATIIADLWKPITWDTAKVEAVFGDGKGQANWKDVADVMGVTSSKPHDRFTLKTRFPISSFLGTCNHYSLSPFLFLVDANSIDVKNSKQNAAKPTPQPKLPKPTLRRSTIVRKVDALEQTVAVLQKKYHTMQQGYDDLQQKYQVLLRMYNMHMGINGIIDMAAESEPAFKK